LMVRIDGFGFIRAIPLDCKRCRTRVMPESGDTAYL
jgi:hypothetical protein